MTWQIFIMMDTLQKVQVIVNDNCPISELMEKIAAHSQIPVGTSYRLYTSDGISFQDDECNGKQRLSDYHIRNKSTLNLTVGLIGGVWPTSSELERQPRNPRPSSRIKITTLHPDVCCLDDDNPRVVMPCGHAIAPHSLASHCLYELEKKKYQISCPGNDCKCIWPFSLVREAACLSNNETAEFEQRLLLNQKRAGVKQCPNCSVSCHRKLDTDKRVGCLYCKSNGKADYEFCWHCLREWKSLGRDSCGNSGCKDNSELNRILAECNTKSLLGKQCPSIRACPSCSLKIEIISGCKHMTCKACKYEFCFLCLKTHEWLAQSMQPCDVAPRQSFDITFANEFPSAIIHSAKSLPDVFPGRLGVAARNEIPSPKTRMAASNLSLHRPTSDITYEYAFPEEERIDSSYTYLQTEKRRPTKKRTRRRLRCVIS